MSKTTPWTLAVLTLCAAGSASCAMHPFAPVMKPTGDLARAASGRGRVPVMTPTGDDKKAVDPSNPAAPSPPTK